MVEVKELYDVCLVDGFDIEIRECEHEFKQNRCTPFDSKTCITYQKCQKCKVETIKKLVKRCEYCLNIIMITTEED